MNARCVNTVVTASSIIYNLLFLGETDTCKPEHSGLVTMQREAETRKRACSSPKQGQRNNLFV